MIATPQINADQWRLGPAGGIARTGMRVTPCMRKRKACRIIRRLMSVTKKPDIRWEIEPSARGTGFGEDHLSALVYHSMNLSSVRGENMLRRPQPRAARAHRVNPIENNRGFIARSRTT